MYGRKVFGIAISEQSGSLLEEVEAIYGTILSERIVEGLPPDTQGFADVSVDGTPIIAINPVCGRNEDNIAHELFHLKMLGEGFPLFEFKSDSELIRKNKEFLNWMRVKIYDPMTHRLFFPSMRRMGLDPDSHVIRAYHENKEGGYQPSEEALALYYYRLGLELKDFEILEDTEEWYSVNRWDFSLKKGKGMIRIVEEADPQTPDAIIDCFVECTNLLLKGKSRFELLQVDERRHGNIRRRYAILSLS